MPRKIARALVGKSGPLYLDDIADGQVLKKEGSRLVGVTASEQSSTEAFPVGSGFIAFVSTNPSELLGYGTWEALGAGKVLVGLDPNDADFDAAEKTGGAKTKAISAHAGAAVANHASHTHEYSQVVNHTHSVSVNDPGHTHAQASQTATTGGASSWEHGTIDTSSAAAETLPTGSSTTGITATTANPAGGVATGTTAGPSATLTHSVTQPSDHSALNVVQPYIVVHLWKRTA